MDRTRHTQLENIIYAIIWLLVFIVPVFGFREQGTIEWKHLLGYWLRMLPFVFLFLVNNYILIPCLFLRKRNWQYVAAVILVIAGISFALPRPDRDGFEIGVTEISMAADTVIHGNDTMILRPVPQRPPRGVIPGPPGHMIAPAFPGDTTHHTIEVHSAGERFFPPRWRMVALLNFWILSVLVVGFNFAVRFIFKSIRDERHIKELESHTLQAELNYLKAQINPHFFMNTLNNIHALIDFDTEKAKETVIELSKIMRYVLYDADQPRVLLAKEVQFLKNYVELMRIRFTNEIDIRTQFPENLPAVKIPPMMLTILIENAFKHGISYRRDSFIHTFMKVGDGKLYYTVENSVPDLRSRTPGVGMENMRKRLELIYGDDYTLEIKSTIEKYTVTIVIPVQE